MADDFRSNASSLGVGQRRYLRAIAALVVVVAVGLLVALGRTVFAQGHALRAQYVSLINHGQVQVCRLTPARVICPPLSSSLSQSYSASQSKSDSVSKSMSTSTSTSLSP